jgi:hypothetical protein
MLEIVEEYEIEKIEKEEECIICYYDKPITEFVIFDCKHKVCVQCYQLIHKCPVCLKPFEKPEIEIHPIYIPREHVEIIYQTNVHEHSEMSCVVAIICMVMFFLIGFLVIYSISNIKHRHN